MRDPDEIIKGLLDCSANWTSRGSKATLKEAADLIKKLHGSVKRMDDDVSTHMDFLLNQQLRERRIKLAEDLDTERKSHRYFRKRCLDLQEKLGRAEKENKRLKEKLGEYTETFKLSPETGLRSGVSVWAASVAELSNKLEKAEKENECLHSALDVEITDRERLKGLLDEREADLDTVKINGVFEAPYWAWVCHKLVGIEHLNMKAPPNTDKLPPDSIFRAPYLHIRGALRRTDVPTAKAYATYFEVIE